MHIQENQPVELRVKLCEGSSLYSKIAAAVAMVALVLHVVSLSSSYWTEGKIRGGTPIAHTGLWQDCVLAQLFTPLETWVCSSFEAAHHSQEAPGFLKVSQALAVVAVVGHVTTGVLLLVFNLLPKLTNPRLPFRACILATTVSGVCVLVAMAVYPTNYPPRQLPPFTVTWSVSWCFGLDLLSMLGSFVVVVLLVVDYRSRVYQFSTGSAA